MKDEVISAVANLLQKHMPKSKALTYDLHENFSWLENPDDEDFHLLFLLRDEIKLKLESVTSKFGQGWFIVLCRKIYLNENLRLMLLNGF